MTASTLRRTALVIIASLVSGGALVPLEAQQQTPARAGQPAPAQAGGPAAAAQAAVITADRNAYETQERLRQVLEQYPPSLRQVLRLDPSLLSNPDYLSSYPALAAFLAQHPQIAHNPSFYVGDPDRGPWEPRDPRTAAIDMWRATIDTISIIGVMTIVAGALIWLVRTMLDYRRWSRLSKVQVDVHTKVMDRLASNQELLAYMETPAGRRFLESAPIAIDASPRPVGAPFNRILWSVQAGAVLAFGGLGLLFVADRVIDEAQQPLFVLGVLGLAVGIGFVVSAGVAYVLSRRLKLLPDHGAQASDRARPELLS